MGFGIEMSQFGVGLDRGMTLDEMGRAVQGPRMVLQEVEEEPLEGHDLLLSELPTCYLVSSDGIPEVNFPSCSEDNLVRNETAGEDG